MCLDYYILNESSNVCSANCSIADCRVCLIPSVCSACAANYSLNSTSNVCTFNCGLEACLACLPTTSTNTPNPSNTSTNTSNTPNASTTASCVVCAPSYLVLGQVCVLSCPVSHCLACHPSLLSTCLQCS